MEAALIGRYELVRLLGRGGMGEVYEAVLHGPSGFRKRVALKRLRGGQELGDEQRAALVAEARLGALLSHPNVVATWELGQTEEGWYVAMELVRGPSASELRKLGPLGASAVVDLATQAAAGLTHIHELRVDGAVASLVHRDVKPANLLVDRSGLVKVADLGIAGLAGRQESGSVTGTPGYVAPEQLDGQSDARTDLFALGAVLTWLATGIRPFGGGHQALLAVRRCEAVLARKGVLRAVETAVPGLGEVVGRCLRADPGKRWASARELGAALRGLRANLPDGPALADLVTERFPEVAGGVVSTPMGATPQSPTRWTPPPAPPSNLLELGLRVVGRAEELKAVAGALSEASLVLVRGPAGVGKSRVALEVARKLRSEAPGGTWRVDLEEARSVAGVCAEVGRVLRVPLTQGDPVERLGAALAGREATLLLLDDADAAAEHLRDILPSWLGAAPHLRILVACRRRLGAGEREVLVGPLAEDAALELLRERAGAALAEADEGVLRSLVASLDGLPLAVELAAARASFLRPEDLLAKLQDRFRLLASSGRGRHATLRAALDASWELLQPHEQRALAQVSVFAGGFRLEAAEAVLDLGPGSPWALDVLQGLSEHSLVRFDPVARRFRMLPTVREYASSRLDDRQVVEQRHGEYFARLTSVVDPAREGPEVGDSLHVVVRELENLVVAVRRAVERSDVAVATPTVRATTLALQVAGPVAAALPLQDLVLGLPLPDPERAALLVLRSTMATMLGDLSGGEAGVREAIALARSCGAEVTAASGLVDLSNVLRLQGRWGESLRVMETALAQAERLGSLRVLGRAVGDVAILYRRSGRMEEARACLDRGLELHRRLRMPRRIASNLNNYGNLLAQLGELDEARSMYTEGLEISAAIGDEPMAAVLHMNLAVDANRDGLFRQAARHQGRALRSHRRLGHVPESVVCLGNQAWTLTELGDRDEGLALAEEALTLAARHGLEHMSSVALLTRAFDGVLHGDLDAAEADGLRALQLEEAADDERGACAASMLLCWVARERGRLGDCGPFLQRLLAWVDANHDPELLAYTRAEQGWIALAAGDASTALTWAGRALEVAPTTDRIRAHALAIRALGALGRSQEIDAHLRAAARDGAAAGVVDGAPALVILERAVRAVRG